MVRDRERKDRELEMKGVVVTSRVTKAPRDPDAEGMADCVYRFTAQNPGRLPITAIHVEIAFAMPVQRRRRDGTIDAVSEQVHLLVPVVAGGDKYSWTVRLRIPYKDRAQLRDTVKALIIFRDPDGQKRRNRWAASRDDSDDDFLDPDQVLSPRKVRGVRPTVGRRLPRVGTSHSG
jgi:hypothetical protein